MGRADVLYQRECGIDIFDRYETSHVDVTVSAVTAAEGVGGMSAQGTVASVLRGHASTHPGRPALVFAADPLDVSSDQSLSYQQLDAAAAEVATWLRTQVDRGDRALLLFPPGLAFGVAFVGCLYAGVVAVPAPMPASGTAHPKQRATGIAKDCGAAIVLTDTASLAAITAWRDGSGLADLVGRPDDSGPSGLTALRVASAAADGAAQSTVGDGPATTLMLQYTSGSTSDPKGVVISHGNVLAQVAMSRRVMGVGEHTRFGGWLPMYHDMGMIVQLLQPLVLGATSVIMSPFEFLKRPVRWLQLIDRRCIDVSLAPHFAYEVCARHVSDSQAAGLDLSHWSVAGVGAEAVRAHTLTAFARRFAGSGFRAQALTIGYGLAEATVYSSVGSRTDPPQVYAVDANCMERNEFVPIVDDDGAMHPTVVSCGRPCETEIRIVDPRARTPLPDGRIGEVWVRGPGVAHGYWNAPQETVAAFGAELYDGEGGFLRTGDLGTMYDGELYITGRLKDLLIVRGRNLHPQDIEYAVRDLHDAVRDRHGAAFAVPGLAQAEHVVVVQECSGDLAGDRSRLAEVVAVIQEWSAEHLGVRTSAVALLRPGGVSRTSSGKVQRALMRELFMTDQLEAMYEELDPYLRRQYRKDPAGEPNGRSALARGTV